MLWFRLAFCSNSTDRYFVLATFAFNILLNHPLIHANIGLISSKSANDALRLGGKGKTNTVSESNKSDSNTAIERDEPFELNH